jgi:methylmalonyl-CoA mutase N-terminal domain/subunit
MGYDSDHPLAQGEVGKVGVAIDTLKDMEVLFSGIPLEKVSTSMTINSTDAILLAMYIAVGKKQGIEPKTLEGTVQNDILKEYIARGTYIFPPKPSLKIITDIFSYAKEACPKFNTISISGYHIREAGSTAAQEIAYTLLNGLVYVEAAVNASLSIDDFAPRLSFFFNAHNALLEEIAKFRAARRLWARLIKDRYAPKDPRSLMARFHVQTAGSTLTAKQIENNIVRVTIQALAAVLGGCQSLHTNAMDEAIGLPTEASAKLALRTQQLVANETHITDTIDPLGGSFAIEALTDRLESQAKGLMDEVWNRGGVLAAIESGFIKHKIEESAYAHQRAIESNQEIVVGVNDFLEDQEIKITALRVDPELEPGQIESLRRIKATRDAQGLEQALVRLSRAAREDQNLMPPILEAVLAYASVGEIADTLRAVYGTYKGQ